MRPLVHKVSRKFYLFDYKLAHNGRLCKVTHKLHPLDYEISHKVSLLGHTAYHKLRLFDCRVTHVPILLPCLF